ncbi:MAG: ANTAR domain-containing protein [Acinetobacter sp.]|jgi:response regulator NasT|nr:MAG: ANTAR domain-containing protein [Acinetobacter sp.]
MPKLKIALIDNHNERANVLKRSLTDHDFNIVACLTIDHLNKFRLEDLHADILLFNMDHPHQHIIENCVSQFDLPIVLFTQNSHKETIRNAVDAGVTTYIVDGIDPNKLATILTITIEQFKKQQKLKNDLKEIKTKLIDRKDIEKAKVLLMQLHQLSEDAAFQLLRKNAMSHRITMGEMSRRLLDAQELLHAHHI